MPKWKIQNPKLSECWHDTANGKFPPDLRWLATRKTTVCPDCWIKSPLGKLCVRERKWISYLDLSHVPQGLIIIMQMPQFFLKSEPWSPLILAISDRGTCSGVQTWVPHGRVLIIAGCWGGLGSATSVQGDADVASSAPPLRHSDIWWPHLNRYLRVTWLSYPREALQTFSMVDR